MKNKSVFILMIILILFVTGCSFINRKLNKTNYSLKEILEGNNWKLDGQSYIMTDVMNNRYILYFDKKNYNDNFFRMVLDNNPITFYYNTGIVLSSDCKTSDEEIETTQSCSEEEKEKIKTVIYSYAVMMDTLRVQKSDLKIPYDEIPNKYIVVE